MNENAMHNDTINDNPRKNKEKKKLSEWIKEQRVHLEKKERIKDVAMKIE